jgi:predicted GIY-YIG superfamily endonuclease
VPYFYVYILETDTTPKRYYTGFTEALESRLVAHNEGQVLHTSNFEVKAATAF